MFTPWLFFILDWLPFLPFWWFLGLIWAGLWLFYGWPRGRWFGGINCVLLLGSPWFFNSQPRICLLGLGLAGSFYVASFIWLFFRPGKEKIDPKFHRLYRGQKIITLLALLGAVLLTWLFHQPRTLVWRLGLYPSSLAEKWLKRDDSQVLKALLEGLKTANPLRESAVLRILAGIGVNHPLPCEIKTGVVTYLTANQHRMDEETFSYAVELIKTTQLRQAGDFILAGLKKTSLDERIIYPQLVEAARVLRLDKKMLQMFWNQPEDSGAILGAWAELGGRLSSIQLKRLLQVKDAKVRMALLDYWKVAGVSPGLLKAFLAEKSPEVQIKALQLCRVLKFKGGIFEIFPLLREADPEVRSQVNSVLIDLTGVNPGYDFTAKDLDKEQAKWRQYKKL